MKVFKKILNMRIPRLVSCAVIFVYTFFYVFFYAFLPAVLAADFEFRGKIDAQDSISRLLAYYIEEFSPEELLLSLDGQPDDTGFIRDLYMDLTGVLIDEVRVEKLTFRMNGAQFNPPSEWASGKVECDKALQIYANCLLKESDINQRLSSKSFGSGDRWSDISMKIAPSGLHASGNYAAKVLFMTLDILIEVDSGLKIVENKAIWLDNYKVRVNTLDIPNYITQKAVEQIQPLLDLGRFPLPLRLHSVKLEDKQAILSTRLLPQPLSNGITYRYMAE